MESWREMKVSDIGKVVTGNTPPRKNPELYGNQTIFIKPTDVTEDVKYPRNSEHGECT
jgi:type I restriction enzyme, S subunit